jgi:2-methylfumaryl-CoA isomerase
MSMSAPLDGVRIVECATYVAAPSGGMGLARLGAEVIRVDPLGGSPDVGRWPLAPSGASLYWAGLNKGKQSVVLDLASPRGRELLAELASAPGPDAGLLLHNRAGRSWLSDETIRARRPDLIHLAVEGRRDGSPALDYTVNARVGLPYLTGDPGSTDVVNHVLPAWDLLTGALAGTALLAALRRRERTGEGAYLRLALEDVAIASVADLGWLAEAQLTGRDRPRQGNHVYGSYGSAMRSRDGGRVFVMAMTGRQWQALQAATGTRAAFDSLSAALGLDLSSEGGRYTNRELISTVLQRWFETRDLTDATASLDEAGALYAPYGTLAGLAESLLTGAEESVTGQADHPGIGPVLTAGSPIRWAGAQEPAPATAPVLGADTATVLSRVLGLRDTQIAALIADGVAAGPLP